MREDIIRKKGYINPQIMMKHKLYTCSRPDEFSEVFVPFSMNKPVGKKGVVSFEILTKCTNVKTNLDNAGPRGVLYHDFHPLYVREILQHIVLYVFCGRAPSPQIENNFRAQQEDKLHGNDFIYTSFGPNVGRHRGHFKAFFVCQDPDIDQQNRSLYPNWKVRPMLMWLKFVFPLVWLLRLEFSVDDITMGFKVKHKDQIRILVSRRIHFVRKDTLTKYI